MRLTPSQRSCNKSSRFFLNKCPIAATQAFVLHRLRRDGAGDAGINRLDAPKANLSRVSVSRTVWTGGGERCILHERPFSAQQMPEWLWLERTVTSGPYRLFAGM
jgi:hypothetical protein